MNISKSFLKKLINGIDSIKYRRALKKRPDVVSYPFAIQNLELTNKCPMKCTMCVRTYKMTRPQGFMKMAVFTKIIDEIIQINPPFIHGEGFWLHHFGESLLHPDFDEMITYCSTRGVKVGLSLNPVMLTENISTRLIKANPNLLFFAMDGHDDESFQKIRGIPKAFNKSKENILRFLKLKEIYKSNVKVVISMINFPENEQSINKMYLYWKQQKGIDDVHLKPFTDWNGDAIEVTAKIESSKLSANDLVQKTNRLVKCHMPWQMMSITWDGDVVPCCYDYDKKYVLGNVNNNTLLEIWNGDKMKHLRRAFSSNIVENELCKNCRSLYL